MSLYIVERNSLLDVGKTKIVTINFKFMKLLERIFDDRSHGDGSKKFVELLAGSLSLNKYEKLRVLEALVNHLSTFQIDELSEVFSKEKVKFDLLSSEHPEDMHRLQVNRDSDWEEIKKEINVYYGPKLISFDSKETCIRDM